jgi:hypothetical protein
MNAPAFLTPAATPAGQKPRPEKEPGVRDREGVSAPGCDRAVGRLPDFIIAGAPRSGTTWLYHLLELHPQVSMARPVSPEPKFFLVDNIYARGLEYYSSTWFRNAPPDRVVGEKTTNYLESATSAERIAFHLRAVRLVFILRNPAERAYSNYLWSRKNGLETELFPVALAREQTREAELPNELRFARPHAYFSRGLYAELLQPYFGLFPREQILCLRFEDICERPAVLVDRLHRHLGVAPRPVDADALGVINRADPAAPPMAADCRAMLEALYQGPNRRLAALIGEEFWPPTDANCRR